MRSSAALLGLSLALPTLGQSSSCQFTPSTNATQYNYPGGPTYFEKMPPYDLNKLSEVPIASICTSGDSADELECARKYIDAIDEQLAYLYARRLGYAAVAGHAKYRAGNALNDPSRNEQVAAGMAERVVRFGGNADTGTIMGGEGCQIYASLAYEVENIRASCDPNFDEDFSRRCE
ncbi:hypothetical protein VUR80DRAFT_4425 [Thermomyces stellatus]